MSNSKANLEVVKVQDFHKGDFEVRVSYKDGTPVCLARDKKLSRAETKARWILMEHITLAHGSSEPWRINEEYEIKFGEIDKSEGVKFKPSDCFMGADYKAQVVVR